MIIRLVVVMPLPCALFTLHVTDMLPFVFRVGPEENLVWVKELYVTKTSLSHHYLADFPFLCMKNKSVEHEIEVCDQINAMEYVAISILYENGCRKHSSLHVNDNSWSMEVIKRIFVVHIFVQRKQKYFEKLTLDIVCVRWEDDLHLRTWWGICFWIKF